MDSGPPINVVNPNSQGSDIKGQEKSWEWRQENITDIM
jgi:hypothetical protein